MNFEKLFRKNKKFFSTSNFAIQILSIFMLISFANNNVCATETQRAEITKVKVALIHFSPSLGEENSNLTSLTKLIEEALANEANIIVTPELALSGFSIRKDQAIGEFGHLLPYPEFGQIRNLAIKHEAYVFLAFAEKTISDKAFNSVAIFGPSGYVDKQRKRGLSGWHSRGNLPFTTIATKFGDLATIICSDSYLPDWTRVAALKGADIILLPANWWGQDPVYIWQTRARENGVWFFVANRWGIEKDERFDPPYTYNMNDAPSVVISPDGEVKSIYKAKDVSSPSNKIIYFSAEVPNTRIGNTVNPSFSVSFREPNSYTEISNKYYRPDLGNKPYPNLPPPGINRVASISYIPDDLASKNIATIKQMYSLNPDGADIVVLPAHGITGNKKIVLEDLWFEQYPFDKMQSFVNTEHIKLLVSTVNHNNHSSSTPVQSLVIFQKGKEPTIASQAHDSEISRKSTAKSFTIDIPKARVGIISGIDSLFPESITSLAKSGVDILLISSSIGTSSDPKHNNPSSISWKIDNLINLWKTRTNNTIHIAASDKSGYGAIIQNGGGFISKIEKTSPDNKVKILELDSSSVRKKYLNTYYQFELDTLLN